VPSVPGTTARRWPADHGAGLQLAIDVLIIAASLTVLPPDRILVSLVGAAALNLTLAINHRPGRYMAA